MAARPDVVHVMEPLPGPGTTVVYLAGPVPRDPVAPSWHTEAVELFRGEGFTGALVVPRPRGESWPADAESQMAWEAAAQYRADALAFWVPRDMEHLPGLTSNLEWGIWHASGKAILGAPIDAPRMGYLRYWARRGGAPIADTLQATVELTLALLAGPSGA